MEEFGFSITCLVKQLKKFPFADMTINSNLLRVKFSKCIKSETVQGRKITEKLMNRYF